MNLDEEKIFEIWPQRNSSLSQHLIYFTKNVKSGHWRCSIEKALLIISQNSKENTCVGIRHICEVPTQVLSCELCKISKFTFFIEHLRQRLFKNMSTEYFKTSPTFLVYIRNFPYNCGAALNISLTNLKCTFTIKTFSRKYLFPEIWLVSRLKETKQISGGSVLVLDLLISVTLFWAMLPFLNPENSKKPWFSGIFRAYKMKTMLPSVPENIEIYHPAYTFFNLNNGSKQ